ncbi:MAG: glycosyltransferase [Zoogloea sp.]|nr:glycosyltransferase [Zoogloea sp.]
MITGLAMAGAEMMLYKLLQQSPQLRRGKVISLRCGGEMAERLRALGVEVDCLGMRPGVPDPLKLAHLVKILRAEKPDVVSTWMYHADLVGGLAGKIAGIPVVWGIHHSNLGQGGVSKTTGVVVRLCSWFSHRVPTRIACCSWRAQDAHIEAGYAREKMVVVPNGFDLNHFIPDENAKASLSEELQLPRGVRLVGLVGRYDPIKNHRGFVEAARLIIGQREDVHFVLAGLGVDEQNVELLGWIRQAGLVERVHLLGLRTDIPKLTAAFDVAVLTSWGEAFPNVLGEAMACEVPCVTTDAGDAAHIVGDTGVVVTLGDMQALAEGVLALLSMGELEKRKLGVRARARVQNHFEIASVARTYEELFAGVCRS